MSNEPTAAPASSGVWTEDRVAEALYKRELDRTAGGKITDECPELDLKAAYRVQRKLVDLKVADGERIIGVKLGLTARAKQQQMGISSPLTAVLTDKMVLEAGVPIPMDELIHPKIEPEIVFVMRERLAGPGATAASAMAAVASVHAGFEIIDSRFSDFKFTLPDVVADNASSSRLFIGASGTDPASLDLSLEAVVLSVDGTVVSTATGAAVQGHPGEALALAANALAERGEVIEAGAVVLTGGLTDAVFVQPGEQITAEFTNLGTLTVTGA